MPAPYPTIISPSDYLIPPGVRTKQHKAGEKLNVYNDPLFKSDLIGSVSLIEKVSEDTQIEYWKCSYVDGSNTVEITAGIKKEVIVIEGN